MNRWFSIIEGLSLALLLTSHAFAQPTTLDAPGASVQLFQEAEQLAASGNSAAACRKYGESYSLEPRLDSLLRWGDCLEVAGKLASAYQAFADAGELAKRNADPRAASAQARAGALRPRLSFLTVEVPKDRALPSLVLERDGFRIGSSAWGMPQPIDPGSHTIVARAPGYRSFSTTVDVAAEGTALVVEVPALEQGEDAPPVAAAVAVEPPAPPPAPEVAPLAVTPAPAAPAPASPTTDRGPSNTTKIARVAAPVMLGVAAVSAGLGVYFWADRSDILEQRDAICPTSRDCEPGTNARLASMTAEASDSQRAAVVGFALAGTAAAIGAGLWLLPTDDAKRKPRTARVVPLVAAEGGGLLLLGEL